MRHADRYGSWALITGASDGIGKALAGQIAADGINVVLCARSQDKLEALAAELAADHGIETLVLPADLADPGGVDTVADLTDRIDIGLVVLAAGFGTTGSVLETSLTDEVQLIAVNVTAVVRLSHIFARRLAARGSGGLVLFGSIVGWQGVPGQANYAASKAYVQSLAEGLHDELAPSGVDVLAVAPGPVDSGFRRPGGPHDDLGDQTRRRRRRHPGRTGPPHRDSRGTEQVPHRRVDPTAPPGTQPHSRQGDRRNAYSTVTSARKMNAVDGASACRHARSTRRD
ncbi:MAG: SDR family NAD(P)-dependent oxidoreductase [Mycobacterium sp.]